MRHHFDFTLKECNDEKIIFRFYPRQTHVHSFESGKEHDALTPSWDRVYKVYYAWAIIKKTDWSKVEFMDRNDIQSERLFYMDCDECSRVPDLAAIIRYVKESGETFDYPTIGYAAGDWRVEKNTWEDEDGRKFANYKFMVFNNFDNTGYRFLLTEKEVDKFCEWLEMINEYALQHWEEI